MTPADERLPELPEPWGELERSGMWNGSRREGSDEVYTADQMRAYVLADRASRAPVVSEAAVEAAAIGVHDERCRRTCRGVWAGMDEEYRAREISYARAALTAALPHLFAASPAKPEVQS